MEPASKGRPHGNDESASLPVRQRLVRVRRSQDRSLPLRRQLQLRPQLQLQQREGVRLRKRQVVPNAGEEEGGVPQVVRLPLCVSSDHLC